MKSGNIIKAALAAGQKTQVELAEYMGMSKQKISYRIKENAFSMEELERALDFCGYKIKIVDREGASIVKIKNSDNGRIVQMVEGKTYDTGKSHSLCSMYIDSRKNLKAELFVGLDSAYFLAIMPQWGGKPWIIPVPEEAADGIYTDVSGHGLEALDEAD